MAGSHDPRTPQRFVLRYDGEDVKGAPATLLARMKQTPGVEVIDASGRMILAGGPRAVIQTLATLAPDWTITAETRAPLP